MKKFIFIMLFGFALASCTSSENKSKTIFLIRHAEKDTLMAKDPSLTVDGVMRSVDLATWFAGFKVDSVLSSNTKRTMQTAEPLAEAQGLQIGTYDPVDYQAIAESLKEMKGDTIVLIGHSNTILEQIEALGIKKPQESIAESEYDKIFEVQLDAKKVLVHQYGAKFLK